jgi:hypothetical protein
LGATPEGDSTKRQVRARGVPDHLPGRERHARLRLRKPLRVRWSRHREGIVRGNFELLVAAVLLVAVLAGFVVIEVVARTA